MLNAIGLRDLPAPDAHELISIHQVIEGEGIQRLVSGAASMFSTSEFRTYRDATKTLSGVMGYSSLMRVTLGGDAPQEVAGTLVTCNYVDVLRQPPTLGPGFSSDCDAEGTPTVVLGHDLWRTTFGADPAIVGPDVLLDRQAFTVVGVAPEGVRGVAIEPASYFAPIATQSLLRPGFDVYRGEWSWLTLVGRRTGDASLAQVRAELGVIAARIDRQQPPRRTTLVVERARPLSSPEARRETVPVGVVIMTAFLLSPAMAFSVARRGRIVSVSH